MDKYYFLKQYLKLFNRKEEDIKKITMWFFIMPINY
jgi:hypothetical protein